MITLKDGSLYSGQDFLRDVEDLNVRDVEELKLRLRELKTLYGIDLL